MAGVQRYRRRSSSGDEINTPPNRWPGTTNILSNNDAFFQKRKKNLILKCSEYVAYIIHNDIYFKKKPTVSSNNTYAKKVETLKFDSATNVKSMFFTEIDRCTPETFSFDRCSGTTCNVGEREG